MFTRNQVSCRLQRMPCGKFGAGANPANWCGPSPSLRRCIGPVMLPHALSSKRSMQCKLQNRRTRYPHRRSHALSFQPGFQTWRELQFCFVMAGRYPSFWAYFTPSQLRTRLYAPSLRRYDFLSASITNCNRCHHHAVAAPFGPETHNKPNVCDPVNWCRSTLSHFAGRSPYRVRRATGSSGEN